jgi:hypothetical protein
MKTTFYVAPNGAGGVAGRRCYKDFRSYGAK